MLSPLEFREKLMNIDKCPFCGRSMNIGMERLPGSKNVRDTYRASLFCSCGLSYNPNCEELTDALAIDSLTRKWNEAVKRIRLENKGDYKELQQYIDSLANVNLKSEVSQGTYVVEECSELIKELMKQNRGKGNSNNVVSEACDVITTILILLHQMGIDESFVKEQISYKCQRAISRYEASKEK